MKNLFRILFTLFFSSTVAFSGTGSPMASFFIKYQDDQDSERVFNKVRVALLKGGYLFAGGMSNHEKMYEHPDRSEKLLIIIDKTKTNSVQVVFSQSSNTGFNKFASNAYTELKSNIESSLSDHEIVNGEPFVLGTN